MLKVRYASKDEIENLEDRFVTFNPLNFGDTFVVCELNGEICGYAQLHKNYIRCIESMYEGGMMAMVNFLKSQFSHLYAVGADKISVGFWREMGFKPMPSRSPYFDLEWDLEWLAYTH